MQKENLTTAKTTSQNVLENRQKSKFSKIPILRPPKRGLKIGILEKFPVRG